jgi:NAD(P)-dependent dehydrogenase (short-subunit alcohol dehydrogenase family)
MRFEDKVAIVTGAGSGIGRATAVRLAAEGARVVVADVVDESGKETAALITDAGGTAVYVHTDVSSDADTNRLVETAVEQFGGLDIAVNNAGILGNFVPGADIPVEEFDRIVAVNLRGVFLGMKAQVQALRARGGGAIVNVSSAAGTLVQPYAAAYSASKHGVNGLTKGFALDHAGEGIRINAVLPGGVKTNIAAHLDLSAMQAGPDPHPIGHSADPEELAAAIAWLASDDASAVVGSLFAVDGGLTLKLG